MSIDLTPIYTHLNTGLEILGAGVAIWACAKAKQWVDAHIAWLGADTKAKLEKQLEAVLDQAVAWGMAKLEEQEKAHPALATPSGIKGWVADKAGRYVVNHAEGTLTALGLSPEDVAEKVVAKLPPVWVMVPGAPQGLTSIPVEVRPLAEPDGAK